MALAPCTATTFTPTGPWTFYEAVPHHFVASIGQGQTGAAQVLCIYRRPVRITWNCCSGVTAYTMGWRYTTIDAGPTSTLPVLSASIPIPGDVAGALGASITLVNWWVNPAAARILCTGAPAANAKGTDVYDNVKADCNPRRVWHFLWRPSPYVLYPWGAKQKLTPKPGGGWTPGPIVGMAGLGPVLTQLFQEGQIVYVSAGAEIRPVPPETTPIEFEKGTAPPEV